MRQDIQRLAQLRHKPALFERGEALFWDDPHIAQQMLAAHLDPATDAASRKPEIIAAAVAWIMQICGLQPGASLLDLGCGPGLYCQRFAAAGLHVTGVDLSQNSLTYARQHDSASTYLCQNYLTFTPEQPFNAVTLIYGDFCVLNAAEASALLDTIHRALLPGGYFAFDVTTRLHHERFHVDSAWSAHPQGGFWKPDAHLVLRNNYRYPEDNAALEQYIVVEASGQITLHRNWYRYYSAQSITALLEQHGFKLCGLYADLLGSPLQPDSEWIGIIAQSV